MYKQNIRPRLAFGNDISYISFLKKINIFYKRIRAGYSKPKNDYLVDSNYLDIFLDNNFSIRLNLSKNKKFFNFLINNDRIHNNTYLKKKFIFFMDKKKYKFRLLLKNINLILNIKNGWSFLYDSRYFLNYFYKKSNLILFKFILNINTSLKKNISFLNCYLFNLKDIKNKKFYWFDFFKNFSYFCERWLLGSYKEKNSNYLKKNKFLFNLNNFSWLDEKNNLIEDGYLDNYFNNNNRVESLTSDSNTILFDAFRDKLENRNPFGNVNDITNLRWGEDSHLWNKTEYFKEPNLDYISFGFDSIVDRAYSKKLGILDYYANKDLLPVKNLNWVDLNRFRVLNYFIYRVEASESNKFIRNYKKYERKLNSFGVDFKQNSTFPDKIIYNFELYCNSKNLQNYYLYRFGNKYFRFSQDLFNNIWKLHKIFKIRRGIDNNYGFYINNDYFNGIYKNRWVSSFKKNNHNFSLFLDNIDPNIGFYQLIKDSNSSYNNNSLDSFSDLEFDDSDSEDFSGYYSTFFDIRSELLNSQNLDPNNSTIYNFDSWSGDFVDDDNLIFSEDSDNTYLSEDRNLNDAFPFNSENSLKVSSLTDTESLLSTETILDRYDFYDNEYPDFIKNYDLSNIYYNDNLSRELSKRFFLILFWLNNNITDLRIKSLIIDRLVYSLRLSGMPSYFINEYSFYDSRVLLSVDFNSLFKIPSVSLYNNYVIWLIKKNK